MKLDDKLTKFDKRNVLGSQYLTGRENEPLATIVLSVFVVLQ